MVGFGEEKVFYLPKAIEFEQGEVHFIVDTEGPNWVATDRRGSSILSLIGKSLPVCEIIHQYAVMERLDHAKAWLHVHSFMKEALRARVISANPLELKPYAGRAAYLKPDKLRELWVHTNNSCNLACSHCLVSSSPTADRGLPTERIRHILQQAIDCGVERFYFTGGEPFARPDIFELIDFVTRTQNTELIILSNATLFHGERLKRLAACSRELLHLQISLDGAHRETNDRWRGSGTFDQIREGTLAVVRLGFPVSLSTVITKDNLDEIPGVTELAKEWGVQSQHLMWMHRRGRVLETSPRAFPSTAELIRMVRKTKRRAQALGIAVDNIESIRLRVNGNPFVKYDLGNQFWDSLCIYSDGSVYPSAAMANFKPLAAGVVNDGNLRQIWQESKIARRFRETSVAFKLSSADDPFKFILGGGDLEHSYFFSASSVGAGDLLAEDPYYEVNRSIARDIMFDLAEEKRSAFNRRSGFDAPILFHFMGEGAIGCSPKGGSTDERAENEVTTLHSNCVLAFDVEKSRAIVREFYGRAAEEPQPELCCPVHYDLEEISHIPKEVLDRFYGCGSPVAMAGLSLGETMLDLGSGGGIDCFIAAKKVGPDGKVIGVDMTEKMLEIAKRCQEKVAGRLGYDVVEFRPGYLEEIPAQNKSVDVITSNCVINLSPDKKRVFGEMWRVLKDHGRIVVSDIVSEERLPAHMRLNRMLWGECISGALMEEEFLAWLEQSGFYGIQVLKRNYWKEVEGYRFYSITVRAYKSEKRSGCVYRGQRAVYLGPLKGVMDEEGHFFPRNESIEVCTDTAIKLAHPPYKGLFLILEPDATMTGVEQSCCSPADGVCCQGGDEQRSHPCC